jgi:hypothetical protein
MNMTEKDFIEFYRNQVEILDETPPEKSWEEISSQLDIEETWDAVSIELDNVLPVNNGSSIKLKDKNLVTFPRVALLISPLVIIWFLILSDTRKTSLIQPGISIVNDSEFSTGQPVILQNNAEIQTKSGQQVKEAKILPKIIHTPEPMSTERDNLLSEPLKIHKIEIIPIYVSSILNPEYGLSNLKTYPIVPAPVQANLSIYNPVIPAVIPQVQPILYPVVSMSSPVTSLVSGTGKVTENTLTGNDLSPSGKALKRTRFSVGISLTEKNTWLISQETLDGFGRQKLNTTKATFLNDFGIILRYTLNERWSFEGTTFLLSKTGQSYREYLNGIYSAKNYELRYVSFEIGARYALHGLFNSNKVKSYSVGGTYISRLNSAHMTIGNSLYDISPDYDPIDYGLVLGYELEFALFEHFAAVPGFRLKYGIPNIFNDKPGIPQNLHYTSNASLEFRLNLIFPLSKF